jgi:hypothetical protein
MSGTLGICATRRDSLPHLLGITRAARRAGKRVEIFVTGEAVFITQDPRFAEVIAKASVGICEVSYVAAGYQGVEIPGLVDNDFVTQARNAELVERCERYLLL